VTVELKSPEFARIRLALGTSTHFRDLPAASLDALASIARLQRYAEGGPIHPRGAAANRFWIVIAGALRVSWMVSERAGPAIIGIIGEGSFYSVGAFVENATMSTEARAERDTVTAVIDGQELRALQDRDRNIALLVPKLMLSRFQAAASMYADVLSLPMPQRLARRLIAQAMSSGRVSAAQEMELRVSQTDLAALLGAGRSKVNAELRRLEQLGIVRLGYRRLVVSDFERLCAIAGPHVVPL
jgi:CRP-like cAMP-binding protein